MHNLEEKPITLSPGVGSDTVLTRLDVYGNGEDSPSSPQSADIDSAVVETIVPQISVTMDSDSSSESTTGEVSTTEVTVVSGDLTTTPLVSANPHFITVTVAGDDSGPHPTFVQYVEADLYQEQTQIGVYPVYTVSEYGPGSAQTQPQQQYYTATSGTAAYVGSAGPAVVSTAVNTDQYILPGLPGDQEQPGLVVQRSPPPSVNTESAVTWLVNNYETAEGVSLPRSTLYAHYMRHCLEHKIDPVNAASFGKLIRSVFMGLRTRRLGTRGNSKYHYYGIRIKPGSDLNATDDNKSPTAGSTGPMPNNASKLHRNKPSLKPNHYDGTVQYLGDGNNAIPSFPEIQFSKHTSLPEDCSADDVDTFRSIYREHCEAFLDAILNLEFSTIETLWREFWRSNNNNNGDECEEEKYLSKNKLYQLCSLEPVQTFIVQVDFMFYQNIVDVLLPDVLRPIPSTLTQAIRNFAKGLENWLSSAMTGLPSNFIQSKMTAVSAFGQTLRRYTSLNHLAQAARAVLQNSSQISQMLSDLNRVDFHNVQEQAAYVCQCDTMIVRNLEDDFKYTLQQQNSLEQWAIWLKSVMANALRDYHGKPSYARAARQFLLKWSFYSSMIIRDLTLRSAASFGSFHLIRLLYDEYMFYLVEHEVARSNGTTPIAAMADVMSTQAANTVNIEDEEPLDKKIKLS